METSQALSPFEREALAMMHRLFYARPQLALCHKHLFYPVRQNVTQALDLAIVCGQGGGEVLLPHGASPVDFRSVTPPGGDLPFHVSDEVGDLMAGSLQLGMNVTAEKGVGVDVDPWEQRRALGHDTGDDVVELFSRPE
jgi:hypothetical protein